MIVNQYKSAIMVVVYSDKNSVLDQDESLVCLFQSGNALAPQMLLMLPCLLETQVRSFSRQRDSTYSFSIMLFGKKIIALDASVYTMF